MSGRNVGGGATSGDEGAAKKKATAKEENKSAGEMYYCVASVEGGSDDEERLWYQAMFFRGQYLQLIYSAIYYYRDKYHYPSKYIVAMPVCDILYRALATVRAL